MALNGILANTMLQLQAPDHLRGRVMGFYSFTVLGMAPFGALQADGSPSTLACGRRWRWAGGVPGGGARSRVGMVGAGIGRG